MLEERKENEKMKVVNRDSEETSMFKDNAQDFNKQEIILEIIHAFRDIMIEFFRSS